MTVAYVLAAAMLIPLTWISAVALAIKHVSRSALVERASGTRRAGTVAWFEQNNDLAHLAVSLVRTVLRVAFLGAVLVGYTGLGDEAALTLESVVVASLISIAVLWFTSVVVATALARYLGEPLVLSSLGLVRLLSLSIVPVRPVVHVTHESVRRLAGAGDRGASDEADKEILRSIEEQQREGGIDALSAAMLENVVEFKSTDVGEVMTPRTDIDGIAYTDDLRIIRQLIVEHGHSRMPVYEENLDHILGVLYVKDLVRYLGEDATDFTLRPLLRAPIVVPESKPVSELLTDFQRSEVHMAIVVDEYGGTAGIVTIEDVLEELVGEIQDEHDMGVEDIPTLTVVGDGAVEVDGRYHIDDLNEELGLSLPEDEEFDTVAGFMLAELGRVPIAGDTLTVDVAVFTTIAATPTAIDKIRVEIVLPEDTGSGGRRGRNGGRTRAGMRAITEGPAGAKPSVNGSAEASRPSGAGDGDGGRAGGATPAETPSERDRGG